MSAEPEVTQHTVSLPEDEFLVLACDGLWDVCNSAQAVAYLRRQLVARRSAAEAAAALAEHALQRGSTDNITIIVIVFKSLEPVAPPPLLPAAAPAAAAASISEPVAAPSLPHSSIIMSRESERGDELAAVPLAAAEGAPPSDAPLPLAVVPSASGGEAAAPPAV